MSMSISMVKATSKTNLNHNNRELTDKQKEDNKHINYERSHENKYLVQDNIRDLYEREFGQALENYNAKQTRSDRKINDYFKHIQASKKTATQQEMIIQVGDREDFFNEENREIASDVLEEWFNDFEERNPNLKVYNAVIHNDEASPHLHINYVPVASNYKRSLEKQVAFDRAIKQQDPTLDKTRPFDDWRNKEVSVLEKALKERGIERELVGTNQYKDVNDYKHKKDLEKEISLKQKKLDELTSFLPDEQEELPFLKKEKVLFQETENYVLSPEQYEKVSKQIESAATMKKDYERLKNTDLKKLNEKIIEKYNEKMNEFSEHNDKTNSTMQQLLNQNKALTSENSKLETKNNSLNHEVIGLKEKVKYLTEDIKHIYQASKEFVKERTNDVQAFKEMFKAFVDKVRWKTDKQAEIDPEPSNRSEFDNEYIKDITPTRNRDMDMER